MFFLYQIKTFETYVHTLYVKNIIFQNINETKERSHFAKVAKSEDVYFWTHFSDKKLTKKMLTC